MKNTVKTTLIHLVALSGTALAAGGSEGEGSGLVAKLFLGFFAMIIVCQLIPGLTLFASMLKGMFREERLGKKKGGKSVHVR